MNEKRFQYRFQHNLLNKIKELKLRILRMIQTSENDAWEEKVNKSAKNPFSLEGVICKKN